MFYLLQKILTHSFEYYLRLFNTFLIRRETILYTSFTQYSCKKVYSLNISSSINYNQIELINFGQIIDR